jgi:HK97 family phage major capsid protein
MTLKDLQEKRAKIAAEMKAMHEAAEKAERGFTTDEDAKWIAADSEIEALDAQIKRSQRVAGLGATVPTELRAAGRLAGKPDEKTEGDEVRAEEKRVFEKMIRHGVAELEPEERTLMLSKRDTSQEARALSGAAGNTGAYTVPQDFRDQLEIALKAYGGMLGVSDIMTTDTGAVLPMPTFNYTGVLATIVGEGVTGGTDSSTPFGIANLGAFTYRTPILPISYELLQDSAFGSDYIVNALSGSIGRALNAHFTNGTGTGQPRGIMLDAVSGKVGLTGQTVGIIYDDLVDLVHSIDPAYRNSGGAKMMMHDSSLKVIRKMKDSQGRPIYLPGYDGLAGAMSDQVMGFDAVINQDMPVMAANAKSIIFGQLGKYKARQVRAVTLLRLVERYADNLQVAFLMFARWDGRLLDAGTNPVKYYQNSAT